MTRLKNHVRSILTRAEEGQSYAYGGGGLLLVVVVVLLFVFLFR